MKHLQKITIGAIAGLALLVSCEDKESISEQTSKNPA